MKPELTFDEAIRMIEDRLTRLGLYCKVQTAREKGTLTMTDITITIKRKEEAQQLSQALYRGLLDIPLTNPPP